MHKNTLTCDTTEKGVIQTISCPTEEMTPDILSKPLAQDHFENLQIKMGNLNMGVGKLQPCMLLL